MADAAGVVALCNAAEASFDGATRHDVARRRIDWQRSYVDLTRDTLVAEAAGGRIAGYAAVQDRDEHLAIEGSYWIDPTASHPGLEERLLDWLESRARGAIPQAPKRARVTLRQKIPSQDDHRSRLLETRGYTPIRHFVRMRIDLASCPQPPRLPEGVTVRAFDKSHDLPALAIATREAFSGHWGHVERTKEDDVWRYEHWLNDDPQLDPSLWHLAVEKDAVIGVCLGTTHWAGLEKLAYIFTLGVRPSWRGRGVGEALLRHAFRCFYLNNRPSVELDVDAENGTGAMQLYEAVGMRRKWQKVLYELELRPETAPSDR